MTIMRLMIVIGLRLQAKAESAKVIKLSTQTLGNVSLATKSSGRESLLISKARFQQLRIQDRDAGVVVLSDSAVESVLERVVIGSWDKGGLSQQVICARRIEDHPAIGQGNQDTEIRSIIHQVLAAYSHQEVIARSVQQGTLDQSLVTEQVNLRQTFEHGAERPIWLQEHRREAADVVDGSARTIVVQAHNRVSAHVEYI